VRISRITAGIASSPNYYLLCWHLWWCIEVDSQTYRISASAAVSAASIATTKFGLERSLYNVLRYAINSGRGRTATPKTEPNGHSLPRLSSPLQ